MTARAGAPNSDVRRRVARLDDLLAALEVIVEPSAREAALGAVQGLVDLYGEGLSRMVGHIGDGCSDETSDRLAEAFASDELVSHLLILHGLHPYDIQARVEQALERVRPYLASHGGGVELMAIEDGVATMKLSGSCHGCSSSELALRAMVEAAVRSAAPDLRTIAHDGTMPATHPVVEHADMPVLITLTRAARPAQAGSALPVAT